jgi:hypothetical protein
MLRLYRLEDVGLGLAAQDAEPVGGHIGLGAAARRRVVGQEEGRDAEGAGQIRQRAAVRLDLHAAVEAREGVAKARVGVLVDEGEGGLRGDAGPVILADEELAKEVVVVGAGQVIEGALGGGGQGLIGQDLVQLGQGERGLAAVVEDLAGTVAQATLTGAKPWQKSPFGFCM